MNSPTAIKQHDPFISKEKLKIGLATFLASSAILGGLIYYIVFNNDHAENLQVSTEPEPQIPQINSLKLNQLEQTIQNLQSQLNAQQNSVTDELYALYTNLTTLQEELTTIAQQHNDSQQEQIPSEQLQLTDNTVKSLQQKLDQLKQETAQIKATIHTPQELPDTALPFQVISIDYWNGLPLVTIQIQEHYELVAAKETKAGWQLTEINVGKQLAVFTNQQGQQARVTL